MARILIAAHTLWIALCGKASVLTGVRRPDPFARLLGTVDALMAQATARRDMRSVGQLQAAKNVITRELLRGTH